MPRFNLDDYIDVQTRINRFWEENPGGSISTDIAAITQDHKSVVVIATVRKDEAGPVAATGIAQETAGGHGANVGSWVENCETSAIGRALANMGYATSGADRMSREEAMRANRFAEQGDRPAAAPAPARGNGNGAARQDDAGDDGPKRSDAQGRNIFRLMKECERQLDMSKTQFQEECTRQGWPRDDRNMTVQQASDAIRHFKVMLGEPVDD